MLPDAAPAALARAGAPWWIAGGWAVDLFVGRTTRAHEDLDVVILRRDEQRVRARLPELEFHAGHGDGVIEPQPLPAHEPAPGRVLWARPTGSAAWSFEFLLAESEGDEWVFTRDARVRRPLTQLGALDARGIPFLAPEVVLLYKAKARRPVDELDLATALPRMTPQQVAWLRDALALAHPGHAWISRL